MTRRNIPLCVYSRGTLVTCCKDRVKLGQAVMSPQKSKVCSTEFPLLGITLPFLICKENLLFLSTCCLLTRAIGGGA